MSSAELDHLELLAEVESLHGQLEAWAEGLPSWPPARGLKTLVRRLIFRADQLRVRLEAPLVVATLGGTGTGKSTLVNALVGEEVATVGRERPTTRQPTLICRPDLRPEDLGIDSDAVHLVQRDLPVLRDLVLLDCPDPDTTEDADAAGTNLARLRQLLPHCDVLLITGTQQKYRSARVLHELASAATGARLVFVQTHADVEDDIRDDWRAMLAEQYESGEIFFVDSLRAKADARAGLRPRGDFARLMDLLTRELAGSAGVRIRRANFLDLAEQTVESCRERLEEALEPVGRLEQALRTQRERLSQELSRALREELMQSRRQWERMLLSAVADRWGFSPFGIVLRGYQAVGGLLSASLLYRVRSPLQLALWGAVEGGRRLRSSHQRRRAQSAPARALALGLNEANLRQSVLVLEGYAQEAQLEFDAADLENSARAADRMAESLMADVSLRLQTLITQLARRRTGRFTRWTFEILWLALLIPLLLRMGKNFFWDSWFASNPVPVYGLEFFVAAAFWLFVWASVLVWLLASRMRRELSADVSNMAGAWSGDESVVTLFEPIEAQIRRIVDCRHGLDHLEGRIVDLKSRLARDEPRVGRRTAPHEPVEN